jgi:antitoxin YefM
MDFPLICSRLARWIGLRQQDRRRCGVIDIGQSFVHILQMQTVSYSEARENLKAMIDKVVADRAPLAITRQRGEGAVLISESEWASIEETLYLLSSPANATHLMDGIAQLDAGNGEEHELIKP